MSSNDIQHQVDRLNQDISNLYQQGHYEEAAGLAEKAVNLSRSFVGEEHPDFATSLNNLAGVYAAMGNHAAAVTLYRQALEIKRHVLGEQHPEFATSLFNLAALYAAMGNHAAAEPLYRQAREITENL